MNAKATVSDDTNYSNPLKGRAGGITFLTLSLSQLTLSFIICSNLFDTIEAQRLLIFQIYLLILGLGWYAFAVCTDLEDFLRKLGIIVLSCGAIITTILIKQEIVFWLSLSIIAGLTIGVVTSSSEGFWAGFYHSVYSLWVVLGVFIKLGDPKYLDYAKPAYELRETHIFLDVRYLLGTVAILSSVANAIIKAIHSEVPDIRSIPNLTLRDTSKGLSPFLAGLFRPFIILINTFLRVIQLVLDILWKLIALFLTYLTRTGVNLAKHFAEIITNKEGWKSTFQILFTFLFIAIFTAAVKLVSVQIILYLRSATPFSVISIYTPAGQSLMWISGLFFISLFSILWLCWIWSELNFLFPAMFGGIMILVSAWLTGLTIYLLAQFKRLGIQGFDLTGISSLGTFTLFTLCVVIIAFIVQLIRQVLHS